MFWEHEPHGWVDRGVSGFLMKESECRVPFGEFSRVKITLFLLSVFHVKSTQVTDLQRVDLSLVWNCGSDALVDKNLKP